MLPLLLSGAYNMTISALPKSLLALCPLFKKLLYFKYVFLCLLYEVQETIAHKASMAFNCEFEVQQSGDIISSHQEQFLSSPNLFQRDPHMDSPGAIKVK